MEPTALAAERVNCASASLSSLTMLLSQAGNGDEEALANVYPLVYRDLHRIAEGCVRGETPGHTLQATALIHEAYLRMVRQHDVDYRDRNHFFALAARIMRRTLVDHARARRAAKRGSAVKTTLEENMDVKASQEEIVMQLDDALKQLAKENQMRARLVEMRFFGGMSAEEIGESVGMPVYTVRRELRRAQTWIRQEIAA